MTKQVVPVCNDCNKPWVGPSNSSDRCWCDPSSSYREEERELEETAPTYSESKSPTFSIVSASEMIATLANLKMPEVPHKVELEQMKWNLMKQLKNQSK